MIWATVITDASFSSIDNSAGWAAWVRVDGTPDPIKGSGPFREKIKTSTDAEILAAINGAWLAKKHGADAALVQSDCLMVIHLLNGFTRKRELISRWNILLEKAGMTGFPMRGRHVKGHSKTDDARSYINRWCDREAGRARKASIK